MAFKEGGKRHTLAIIAEAHLGLAEANGVLAGADAIELLELGLFDILNEWKSGGQLAPEAFKTADEGQKKKVG